MSAEQKLWRGDPKKLGRYRIVHRLASGGMGFVYLGVDSWGRFAAIKVLRPDLAADDALIDRFRREVEAARRIQSEHTARVIDFEVEPIPPHLGSKRSPRRMFLVTEFVPGPTLRTWIKRLGPLEGPAAKSVALSLAEALASIHGAGLVHRDFKPSNIILSSTGPRVVDFGIATALDDTSETWSSFAVGTPGWMAPEQINGEPVGPAADIFAWGLVITFSSTGRGAFGNGTLEEMRYRLLHARPELGGMERRLKAVVTASLSLSWASRPTARELLASIGEWGENETGLRTGISTLPR